MGAEDAVGEEPCDGFDDEVFADEDVGRMGGVPRLVAVVALADAAPVVGVLLAHLAAHAPATQVADDEGPHDVGAGGDRVRVPSRAAARALPESPDGGGRFEQRPGDERLVGRAARPDPLGGWIHSSPSPLMTNIDMLAPRKALLVAGADAHSRYYSEDVQAKAPGQRESI